MTQKIEWLRILHNDGSIFGVVSPGFNYSSYPCGHWFVGNVVFSNNISDVLPDLVSNLFPSGVFVWVVLVQYDHSQLQHKNTIYLGPWHTSNFYNSLFWSYFYCIYVIAFPKILPKFLWCHLFCYLLPWSNLNLPRLRVAMARVRGVCKVC